MSPRVNNAGRGTFAVSEQRFAGRRDAGGVMGTLLPLARQRDQQYFDWRTVFQHHVYLADGASFSHCLRRPWCAGDATAHVNPHG